MYVLNKYILYITFLYNYEYMYNKLITYTYYSICTINSILYDCYFYNIVF